MCGIVGYIGFNQAADFLLDGMAKLEYRGYDSAGIAVIGANNVIKIQKKVGRLANLEAIVKQDPNEGVVGIGHTRWATHGRPSDMNSHPHADENMKFAVVHNGIIENYMPLKEELLQKGYHFKSETDTEVIAHLLADMYDGNFEGTVRRMLDRVDGAYMGVMAANYVMSETLNQAGMLVFDDSLPYATADFSLSSIAHPEVIKQMNEFLVKEKTTVTKLKAKYKIVE